MGNSSLTYGYLTPNTPYPADDDALTAILQGMVVGITGLDGTLVRPRWQPVIPKMPEPSTSWCAIGVSTTVPDDGPYIGYDPLNDVGPYIRHETIELACTFYGPQAKQYVSILRDGLGIPQNTDVLRANNMAWVSCGPIQQVPELFNQQWIRRQDMTVTLRREVTRTYNITYLAIAAVDLRTDGTPALDSESVIPPTATLEP
jgi:hypothetical protein